MANVCVHGYVWGKVQGVFFRQNTMERANDLGLTGWVKNLPDGRVEFMACGDELKLAKFMEWVQQGPAAAKVDHVESKQQKYENFDRFKVTG